MEIFEDGDLLTLLKNQVFTPSLDEKLNICKQLSAGLLHLHSENVIHCDIACRYRFNRLFKICASHVLKFIFFLYKFSNFDFSEQFFR